MPRPEVWEAATHWSFLFPHLCFLHTASKRPWDPVGNHVGMKVFGKLQRARGQLLMTQRGKGLRIKQERLSETAGRQGFLRTRAGRRSRSLRQTSSLSPGRAGPYDLGQGQRPMADPEQMCMVCRSGSQHPVTPWPEAEDSLAIRNLSLWPSGHPLRQGLARARLPALRCS